MTTHPHDPGREPDTDALRKAVVTNADAHQFLSAGAGAGKTTVLVERYFELLRQGNLPHQMVAVTFTEKAAAEMKARLRDKCRAYARDRRAGRTTGAEDCADWDSLLHEIEIAPISTIHGLCARLLRENSLVAGLDPDFSVMDETDSGMLLDEAVRQSLLSRMGTEPTADTLAVALGYDAAVTHVTTLVRDRVKVNSVLQDSAYDSPQTLLDAWQAQWLDGARDLLRRILSSDEYARAVDHICSTRGPEGDLLEERRQVICGIITRYDLSPGAPGEPSPERCRQLLEGLAALQAVRGGGAGKAPDWQKLGLSKEEMVDAQNALIHKERFLGGFKEDISALHVDPTLDEACAALTCAVVAEARAARDAYTLAREQRSAVDFEDLLERTCQLWLDHPEALERTRKPLRHVMIDEFQDTNTLQKQVLWALVTGTPYDPGAPCSLPGAGPRLFVVGDAKQSIYRFRNADVTVFNTTRDEMTAPGSRSDELTRNFRSTRDLIDFCNAIFTRSEVLGTHAPEPYKATYAPMQAVRDNPPTAQPPVEIHLLMRERGEDDSETGEEGGVTTLREEEARWLAQRLVCLLTSGEFQVQRGRGEDASWEPVRPGDIAILFRSMTDVALYERALREAQLPYYLVVGRGFFAAQEVQDVVHALRAVENDLDDIALVGALRSPLFGLSDETLYWLGQMGPGSWWQRLRNAMKAPEEEGHREAAARIAVDQLPRVRHAATLLDELRRIKNRVSLATLAQTLLDRTGYTATLAAQFSGHQAVSNARKLVELAGEFEGGRRALGQGSLRDFIEHLRLMTAREVREEQAPVEEEAGNSIKLITYHSAKGLQWPVVVAADLCRQPGGDFGAPYRFHPEVGLAARTTPLIKRGTEGNYWPHPARLIKTRNEAEEEAENRRLFYVAATRAQDLLILSGVTALSTKGAVSAGARRGPMGWLNAALGEALWGEDGNHVGEGLLRWREGGLFPMHDPVTCAERYSPPTDPPASPSAPEDASTLATRLADIPPAARGQARFTATEISLYRHCPRLYELERRLGLPGVLPSFGGMNAGGRLNPMELGTVVHRVLQLVGTGGLQELDRLVPRDATTLRLDTTLDKRAATGAATIRRRVLAFLNDDLYGELFQPANPLRSEANLAFLLPVNGREVVIEGVVDALLQTPEGACHLLDYKTGRQDLEKEAQYRIQVGLYCHAVQAATGKPPQSAALVYLGGDGAQVTRLDVSAAIREALEAAREAVQGIWQGDFARREDQDCGYCVGKPFCGRESGPEQDATGPQEP